jgi:hypothetical protein
MSKSTAINMPERVRILVGECLSPLNVPLLDKFLLEIIISASRNHEDIKAY